MVKAIEQIRRDLTTVTERVTTVKQALETVYADYLNALGESIKRQLVLAGYQLCTQIYPQTFLKLSYRQRQGIQQELRLLSDQAHQKLQRLLSEESELETASEEFEEFTAEEDEESLEQELLDVFETIDQAMGDEDSHGKKQRNEEASDGKQRRSELSQLAERIAESIAEMMHTPHEEEPTDENSPEYLIEWYRTMEKRIRLVLNQVSQKANHVLQKGQILPAHIPTKVLDMAVQADNQQNSSPAPTNLVSVLIEADLGKKKKRRTRITAIHLKISEIEFSDPTVSAQRNRIREQLAKVKQLKQYYNKSKQDLAIAEAEAAWRSSWHEGDLNR